MRRVGGCVQRACMTMDMELIRKKQFNDAVERVLHVKGNYTGGILEMTLVIDCGLSGEYAARMAADIAGTLRSHSEVFRNVRLNLVWFVSDEEIINQVRSLPFLQMSDSFAGYRCIEAQRTLDALTRNLKLFHARSKLILVLAAGERMKIKNVQALQQDMRPFLGKKTLFWFQSGTRQQWVRGEEVMRELEAAPSGETEKKNDS